MGGDGAGSEAEAAPVFRDNDAVFRAVDVVADGAGKAEAKILRLNVVAEGGDVLGAFVGDAADFVLVEDEVDFLKVRGAGGVEVGDGGFRNIENVSVDDAAGADQLNAAFALDFLGGGTAAGHRPCRRADDGENRNAERLEDVGIAQ